MVKPFWRIVLLSLAAVPGIAMSCSVYPKPSDEQMFDRAEQVFIARIVKTKLKGVSKRECDAEDCEFVEGGYELIEGFKGKPRRYGKVIDVVYGPGTCSVGLISGWYYVFYMGPDKVVTWPSGTYALGPWLEEEDLLKFEFIERQLGLRFQKIIGFCDDEAAKTLRNKSWLAAISSIMGVISIVADVPESTKSSIIAAQLRQKMTNI